MSPVLIGYMAKRTARAGPEHKLPPHVREIASVSSCISEEADWIERWVHNDLGFFDSPALALSVVPEDDRGLYEVYAYKVLPCLFAPPEPRPWDLSGIAPVALTPDYRRLGFDVVSRSYDFFDCSPLSCNYMASELRVNERCLFDSEEDALELIRSGKLLGGERGPYAVFEVWRRRP